MTPKLFEWTWLDARETIDATELARACAMTLEELDELVDYGALVPVQAAPQRVFSAECVAPLRKASRLRADFELDLFTVAMVLGYLARIDALEQQLQSLKAHLPGYTRPGA